MSGVSNQMIVVVSAESTVGPSRALDVDEFSELVGAQEPAVFVASRNSWLPVALRQLAAASEAVGISCLFEPDGWVTVGTSLERLEEGLKSIVTAIGADPSLLAKAGRRSESDARTLVEMPPQSLSQALDGLATHEAWDEGQGLGVLYYFVFAALFLVRAGREQRGAVLTFVSIY